MNPFDDRFKCRDGDVEDEESGANLAPLAGGVELLDCDDAPVSEDEIPDDPNRWTLPEIREGAAVALFICMAPALVACVAATGVGTLALLKQTLDE